MKERFITAARANLERAEARRVPAHLQARYATAAVEGSRAPAEIASARGVAKDGSVVWHERLARNRRSIVPWLDRTRSLDGSRIIEIGSGRGASTVALAEQGAVVTGIDINEHHIEYARLKLEAFQVEASLRVGNADRLQDFFPAASVDWVIFWATLEHMTHDERQAALSQAWTSLRPGGLLTTIETPNLLWYLDSHTSFLPFYQWLDDDVAFDYSRFSPRESLNRASHDRTEQGAFLTFRRRGRGVSYHDYELAIAPLEELQVCSCMQTERRRSSVIRRLVHEASRAGRYIRFLNGVRPGLPAAFLEPFLYFTLQKPL